MILLKAVPTETETCIQMHWCMGSSVVCDELHEGLVEMCYKCYTRPFKFPLQYINTALLSDSLPSVGCVIRLHCSQVCYSFQSVVFATEDWDIREMKACFPFSYLFM